MADDLPAGKRFRAALLEPFERVWSDYCNTLCVMADAYGLARRSRKGISGAFEDLFAVSYNMTGFLNDWSIFSPVPTPPDDAVKFVRAAIAWGETTTPTYLRREFDDYSCETTRRMKSLTVAAMLYHRSCGNVRRWDR